MSIAISMRLHMSLESFSTTEIEWHFGPGRINVYTFGKPYLLIFQV
jgi:hypothetical protein